MIPEINALCMAGLSLVAIEPVNGNPSKAPTAKGWNLPRSSGNANGYSKNQEDFNGCNGFNFGLFHGASGTIAFDIDDLEQCTKLFQDIAGINITDWLNDPNRFEIKSPKPNRGKLIFKLPTDFNNAGLRQYKFKGKVIFELRSGNCQDVIYGKHPEGGNYGAIGNPGEIPTCPDILLNMLQNWDVWKLCFDSVLGIEKEPPKIKAYKPQKDKNLQGRRDPIQEFSQSHACAEILERNGYQPKGNDRFLRPGSESKAPGAVIMRNCADGIERVYSHGGDVLNDGYAHDAFDCYRLLECDGEWDKALAWNSEITQHNQTLWREQQANEKTGSTLTHMDGFPLIPAPALTIELVSPDWLLNGIIERGSLNLLWGDPSTGKTLFALDWGFCIASGRVWHGQRTQQTNVVIVAGEGHSGIRRRLKALEMKYHVQAPETLFVSQRSAQFLDDKDAALVAESIKATCPDPGLVVIDTMHRNMDGDENSSQDIGKFIKHLDCFLKPLGVAVLIVHHSGHHAKDRGRGSSSIRAAMDGEFATTKDGDNIILTCHKSKDFVAFKPIAFQLKIVELDGWHDDDGKVLTSIYLEYMGETKIMPKKGSLNARQIAVLSSLSDAIRELGVAPPKEIDERFGITKLSDSKIVLIENWRTYAYKLINSESDKKDSKRVTFKRYRNKLLELRKIIEYDGYVWPI